MLVDTSVWSLALRRRRPVTDAVTSALASSISDGSVVMLGAVRQEVLSGIREEAAYAALRDKLRAFRDLPLLAEDHERAAQFFNRCRSRGVQGANTDFLICSVAVRLDCPILTTDRDFEVFAEHLPIELADIR